MLMNSAKKAILVLAVAVAAVGATSAAAVADSGTQGVAANSPGILSGNVLQVPINLPLDFIGNSINVLGVLNDAEAGEAFNG